MSAERNIEIKRKHLCIKYLKEYQGKNCKASNCKLCKGFHNTLLHKSKPSTEETNNNETKASHSDSFSNSTKIHDTKQVTTASKSIIYRFESVLQRDPLKFFSQQLHY